MKFLIDQDVYHQTVRLLRELDHDVLTAKEAKLHRVSDYKLLNEARDRGRILVTRDKDFGALSFLRAEHSAGVVLLRIQPTTIESVHEQLKELLTAATRDCYPDRFT